MKNLIKTLSFIMVFLSILGIFAFAATCTKDFDCNKDGSICINYKYNGVPLKNIKFRVYQITSIDENENHIFKENFSNLDVDINAQESEKVWLSFRTKVSNEIQKNMLQPDQIFYTNNAGQYNLEDLDLGIYFIRGEIASQNGREYMSEPIFICVGSYNDISRLWVYDYTVKPKLTSISHENHSVSVKKVWGNTSSEDKIPDEIKIQLLCDGEIFDTISLNEQNSWFYLWNDIDPYASWSIKELDELEDFEVSYERDGYSFTVTNTYIGKEDEEIPQTGTLSYLVPILSGFGLIFIMVGVLLRRNSGD